MSSTSASGPASAVPAGEPGQDHLAGCPPPALAALWQSDRVT